MFLLYSLSLGSPIWPIGVGASGFARSEPIVGYATDRPPRLKKLPEVLIIIFPRNYEILTNRHKIEISTKHQIARVDSGETITRQE
jgi:hypothetical protein